MAVAEEPETSQERPAVEAEGTRQDGAETAAPARDQKKKPTRTHNGAGRPKSTQRNARAKPTAPFRPSDRDLEIVGFLGRLRLARAAQIAERFETTESKAYARLRGLKALGWVRHRRDGVPGPGVFLATREGLRVAGVDLSEASYSATSLAHDLAVVDVASKLERHDFSVQSERELRRAGEGAISVQVPGASRRASHLPDLFATSPAGQRFAVEVELTQKAAARTRAILSAYTRERDLTSVAYFVPDPAAEARVRRLGAEVGATKLLEVRVLGESSEEAERRAEERRREEEEEREAAERARAERREEREAQAQERSAAAELGREAFRREQAEERVERLAGWLCALVEASGRERKALLAELEELHGRGGLARGIVPPVR